MEDKIEDVALAIERAMFAPHELPLSTELHEKYRLTALAAIEAMFSEEGWQTLVDAELFASYPGKTFNQEKST